MIYVCGDTQLMGGMERTWCMVWVVKCLVVCMVCNWCEFVWYKCDLCAVNLGCHSVSRISVLRL